MKVYLQLRTYIPLVDFELKLFHTTEPSNTHVVLNFTFAQNHLTCSGVMVISELPCSCR